MSEVTITPSWKQAVHDLLREFKYGDLITIEWMEDRFGMPSLADTQRMSADEYRERQFAWLANVEAFKTELLKEHQVLLQSVRGRGYRWVPPNEQTEVALQDFKRDAGKVFRSTGHKLRNLRHLELTDEERRANADASAKLTALAGMTKRALR